MAILNGIKRVQAESHISPRQRLPITPDIFAVIHLFLPDDRAGHMVWAAWHLTGFFGFLRTAEFTVPAANQYVHLSLANVSIDNHTAPSVVKLTIKQSKTDPFRQGVDIFLGRTSSRICPVSALTTYLAESGPSPGPLFTLPHGSPLTRHHLVDVVKCCLRTGGLDDSAYNGHSFRIGAATTAAARGLEDSLIQTLGRWKSSAYLRYTAGQSSSYFPNSSLLVIVFFHFIFPFLFFPSLVNNIIIPDSVHLLCISYLFGGWLRVD